MKAIIVDVDGTLADLRHRLHFIAGTHKDYEAFYRTVSDDPVIWPVRDLVNLVNTPDVLIILCSGRPDSTRAATVAWMHKHGVQYDALYMRQTGDYRPDHVIKAELYQQILKDGYEPFIAIDDRPSIVALWRSLGLVCLQAAPEEIQTAPDTARLGLMVGPSGAGKSTWLTSDVAKDYGIHPAHVVSSDQIRQDLCGDWRDQSKNDQVFEALHKIVRARIMAGLPTVVDATNLRRKDRLAVVDCALAGVPVTYYVLDRPMANKTADGAWRNDVQVKGIPLMEYHAQTFRSQIKDILAGDGVAKVVDLRILR